MVGILVHGDNHFVVRVRCLIALPPSRCIIRHAVLHPLGFRARCGEHGISYPVSLAQPK